MSVCLAEWLTLILIQEKKYSAANSSVSTPVSVSDTGLNEINGAIFIFRISLSLTNLQYYGNYWLIKTLSDVDWLWALSAALWVSLLTLRCAFRA